MIALSVTQTSPCQEQTKYIEKNMENYGFCVKTVCNLISFTKSNSDI